MILVIGGFYQGKREYAKEVLGANRLIGGEEATLEGLKACDGVYHFQDYLQKVWKEEEHLWKHCKQILQENPNLILLMEEMGCGLLPLEKKEREYLNQMGSIMQALRKEAKEVHRVVCGIGKRIDL